ncbi:Putative rRNA maturation factor YbeY [Candidatus Portiera aleyrodidarum]|uniref:rRNA maturation RNase YbeY n=1 Tax=Candidatus Portiera aleyrodidarum TaxID=91844 RepID=UPI0005D956CA|nr:rRNA maturation RNase YbeY [Candidatus Portiera aleyrodidarum]CEL12334.1 Putative rRNA maturation factor YbeY [Candidatus Portiera aleyrodidarum]
MQIKKLPIIINFQYEININNIIKLIIPNEKIIFSWIYLVFQQHYKKRHKYLKELTIRFVEYKEIYILNSYYRGINNLTNILSFPYESPPGIQIPLIGEIVITPNIILYESLQKNKSFIAHFAHIIIHGCLHLIGYNHNNENDAANMENIEYSILEQIKFN